MRKAAILTAATIILCGGCNAPANLELDGTTAETIETSTAAETEVTQEVQVTQDTQQTQEEQTTQEVQTTQEEQETQTVQETQEATEPAEILAIREKYGDAGRMEIEGAGIDVPLYYDFGATKYTEENAAGIYWNSNGVVIIIDHAEQNNFSHIANLNIGAEMVIDGEGYPRKFKLIESWVCDVSGGVYTYPSGVYIEWVPSWYVITCENWPLVRITKWEEVEL